MIKSSDIPDEQWTPQLLRASYASPSQLREEAAALCAQSGDEHHQRFAMALNAEADRWERELKQGVAGGEALDPRPVRTLTSREVASILGGNIATLVECSDVETVRAALAWLYNTEAYWQRITKS